MNKFFGVNFEFDRKKFNSKLNDLIHFNFPAYLCIVDSNVLAISSTSSKYRFILNSAKLNSCDGSFISFLLRIIYKKSFNTYTGPELFEDYISRPYKHLLLGGAHENYLEVVKKAVNNRCSVNNFNYLNIPFSSVENFDYIEIAKKINKVQPQIIWVGLGAPKQEIFMYKLLPFLNYGVMIGVGAAFSFYTGKFRRSKTSFFSLNFTWYHRVLSEPKKQSRRMLFIVLIFPFLFISECFKSIFPYRKW